MAPAVDVRLQIGTGDLSEMGSLRPHVKVLCQFWATCTEGLFRGPPS